MYNTGILNELEIVQWSWF